jgi:hypothetical protein
VDAQVIDLGIHRWRYLPLTRTPHKLLTCDFATPRFTNPLRASRPSAKRPGSLHDRLDERDITDLIPAYRDASIALMSAFGDSDPVSLRLHEPVISETGKCRAITPRTLPTVSPVLAGNSRVGAAR